MRLASLVLLFLLLFTTSASAQSVQENCAWERLFNPRLQCDGGETALANVAADDRDDLVLSEVKRAFVEKGAIVLSSSADADATVEIIVSSNLVRSGYYVRREAVVYVEVKSATSDSVVVVGRGKNSNLRKAAEKAAEDAANKLKNKKEGAKVYIKTP